MKIWVWYAWHISRYRVRNIPYIKQGVLPITWETSQFCSVTCYLVSFYMIFNSLSSVGVYARDFLKWIYPNRVMRMGNMTLELLDLYINSIRNCKAVSLCCPELNALWGNRSGNESVGWVRWSVGLFVCPCIQSTHLETTAAAEGNVGTELVGWCAYSNGTRAKAHPCGGTRFCMV
jgi:hypothetical protein